VGQKIDGRRRWSDLEVAALREHAAKGPEAVAAKVGRSPRAVCEKAAELGVEMAPPPPRVRDRKRREGPSRASRNVPRPEHRPWTSDERRRLRELAPKGAEFVASELGRSVKGVRREAERLRVSLRQAGERRGLLLGQPAGASWMELEGPTADDVRAMREAVLAGEVDLGRLERRVALEAAAARGEVALCPRCTVFPQSRPSGLCERCHLEHLADAHRHG
jgi:hypothetical protein